MTKESVPTTAYDLLKEDVNYIKWVFPESISEDKIDFEKLRQTLGDYVNTGVERFTFSWAGKRNGIQLLQMPSRATLMPDDKESIDFGKASNLFLEGDNLEIMKLLYKAYFGTIKMIYVDPPYNANGDLIYVDNYADPLDNYLKLTTQVDAEGNLLTSNPETSGRKHSAWLSMMYPRLFLARQLLKEDGVIFVSIDNMEFANLRLLMNEIFGEENFVDVFIWKKRYGGGAKEKHLISMHEYILFFAKNKEALKNIFVPNEEEAKKYYKLKDEKYAVRGGYRTHPLEATRSVGVRKNLVYPIPGPDGEIRPKRQWWWEQPRVLKALKNNELEFIKGRDGRWTVHTKQYERDEKGNKRLGKAFSVIDNVYTQHGTAEIEAIFGDSRIFSFPKPTGLIRRLIQVADVQEGEIVLDLFAGSCSTAQAIVDMNTEDDGKRKFIMLQLPEPTPKDSVARQEGYTTIADIGKERIRRVLNASKAQTKLNNENGKSDGFRVFKLTESNYKRWKGVEEKTPDNYAKEMEDHLDVLVKGWKKNNVIYEVTIKEGLQLTSEIQREPKYVFNEIWRVKDLFNESEFLICLDDNIKKQTTKQLEVKKDNVFVCRDLALDDTSASNLSLQCKLKTI